MKSSLTAIVLILITSGCATQVAKAPGCSGPRRPANPNGSVLTTAETAAPAAAPLAAGPPPSCLEPQR
jgi:hypothetical protein